MLYKLDNGKFRVQIRRKGWPRYDKVFGSRKAAEEALKAQRKGLSARPLYSAATTTLQQAADEYFKSAIFRDKKPLTQRTERSKAKPVLAKLGGFALAHLADGQRIAQYRDERFNRISKLTKRPPSATTVRLELAALAAIFEWCVEHKIFATKPTLGIRRPTGRPRKRRLETSEALKLEFLTNNSATNPVLREAGRFASILRELGCRPGELAALERAAVNVKKCTVEFPDTKNNEPRKVHVSDKAAKLLVDQLEWGETHHQQSSYLFTTYTRRGAPRVYEYKSAVGWLRDAGIVMSDFHAHAMRRDYISVSLENGALHTDVMKQVGQRSFAALLVYDQAKSTHPEVRKRLAAGDAMRAAEDLGTVAEALGVDAQELKELIERNKAKVELQRSNLALVPQPVQKIPRSPKSRGRPSVAIVRFPHSSGDE